MSDKCNLQILFRSKGKITASIILSAGFVISRRIYFHRLSTLCLLDVR